MASAQLGARGLPCVQDQLTEQVAIATLDLGVGEDVDGETLSVGIRGELGEPMASNKRRWLRVRRGSSSS
ncbi:hypothetical protein [Enhygromyxa salina]|uniref:hypothetical protein n=1 Tax=Enhygromyxa salina TaxID=215803 RepID=UPI0011B203A3|nr:hypothetical protein [Enhygromyxa salina]